jgi:hypothetical protein
MGGTGSVARWPQANGRSATEAPHRKQSLAQRVSHTRAASVQITRFARALFDDARFDCARPQIVTKYDFVTIRIETSRPQNKDDRLCSTIADVAVHTPGPERDADLLDLGIGAHRRGNLFDGGLRFVGEFDRSRST